MGLLKTITVTALFLGLSVTANSQIFVTMQDIETNEFVDFYDLYDKYNLENNNELIIITWSGVWCNNACVRLIDRYQKVDTSMASIVTVNIDDDEDIAEVLERGYHLNWDKSINLRNYDFNDVFNTSSAPLILNVFDGWITDAFVSYSYYPYKLMLDEGYNVRFIWDSPEDLNGAAWYIYDNEMDEYLDDAIEWILRSIELEPGYSNTDTYAALLFQSGEYTEALKTAKQAIDIAKEQGLDYASTNELINKIIEKM